MSRKKDYRDMYNKGSDQEIEVLFIKKWGELKQLLRNHMWVKPSKARMVDE